MSGFPGDLSKEQEAKLAEFRAKLQTEVDKGEPALREEWGFCDDMILLKFLRARKFVIQDSFKMLVDTMRWRQSFHGGVRSIRDHHVLRQLQRGVGYYRHEDKKGNPIYWVRVRVHDKNDRDLDEMKTYIVHQMELGRTLMKPPVEQSTIVFDLSNVGVRNLDLVIARFIADMLQNNYPECLATGIIFGAPFVFWGFWQVLKPFLDPKTATKIVFVKTLPDMEVYIDRTNVPKSMGGDDIYEFQYAPTALHDRDAQSASAESPEASSVSSSEPISGKKSKKNKGKKNKDPESASSRESKGEDDSSATGTDADGE
eukprot:TRINITY_DN15952_c0_g1_i1.p1 TRINITY_DN15952_c0_g1~~TRINITY_DN15952_c0_g1_i1.p1  ORF type:complete len:314 (+),score=87.71 TRINITY_DN15952_c0_g1_i1:440-1381(+)